MKKDVVQINGVTAPPSPLSYVIRAGDFLYLSSQLSVDLKTHMILKGNINEQTKQALENIKFLLESSGSSMDDIVKVVIYMRDVAKDFERMNSIYCQYFKKGEEPARVTVQAISPIEGVDIEIEVTATAPCSSI